MKIIKFINDKGDTVYSTRVDKDANLSGLQDALVKHQINRINTPDSPVEIINYCLSELSIKQYFLEEIIAFDI